MNRKPLLKKGWQPAISVSLKERCRHFTVELADVRYKRRSIPKFLVVVRKANGYVNIFTVVTLLGNF
jgi:hypothetical protein